MDFFNEQDLKTLREWAGVEYDKTNPTHVDAKNELFSGIWSKTKKWCEEVAKETGLSTNSKRLWHKQAGPGRFIFRPYTWGKLLDERVWTDEIYFTVGVNSDEDQYLQVLLHYQFEVPKHLNDKQIALCDELIREDGRLRFTKKIYPAEFADYDWDRLISETVQYIEEHKKDYYRIIEEVGKLHSNYFTRICWNTDQWKKPSGPEGKSKSPQSFEGMTGLGLEEWLFSEELFHEGYQYGFLQGVNQGNPKEKFVNLDIYTIERTPQGNRTYWVATIKNAEIVEKEDAQKVQEKTGFNKIVDEYYELFQVRETLQDDVSSYIDEEFINVRFKEDDVVYHGEEDLFEIDFDTQRFPRYRLYKGRITDVIDIDDESLKEDNYLDLSDNSTRSRASNRSSEGQRTPGNYQIYRKHDDISELLEKHLNKNKNTGENVTPEAGLGNKAVDMVYEKPNEIVYYEIKTHRKLVYSIREGIGQLLEYAFWKRRPHDKDFKLVLVTHHKPTNTLREYFKKLQENYDLPIHYQQFDMQKNELGELI